MSSESQIGIRNSIATKLLRIVFGFYLVIAIGVTITHMVVEYRHQKNSISQDLVNIQKTFEQGLSVNLWQLNQEALESQVKGMLQIPTIVGVMIHNENDEAIAIGGSINHKGIAGDTEIHVNISGLTNVESAIHKDNRYKSELIEHQFPITYTFKDKTNHIGTAIIYSSSSVVYQRVKLGFIMLVVNAVIKTAALWLIFLWFSNILLRKPLAALTAATGEVSLENLDSFRVDIKTSGRNELKLLEESFNNMIENLNESITERKQAEEQIASSLKEKEVLIREIHHRVKNNMAVITALNKMQMRMTNDNDTKEMLSESNSRIRSMSLVHEKLYMHEDLSNVDVKSYFESLLEYIGESHSINQKGIVLNVQIEINELSLDTLIPCGLITNELVTNAIKYAFIDKAEGQIDVELKRDNGNFLLIVSDNGCGLPEGFVPENSNTLGYHLITTLTNQLEGEIEIRNSNGTKCIITFTEEAET